MKAKVTLLLKITGVVAYFVVLITLMAFLFAWTPVIEKVVNWCSYYPESLEDCR